MDTTVQEKAIAHPVDSRLLEIARHKVVVDLGFRGVDAANPGVQIIHRGKFKSLTEQQRQHVRIQGVPNTAPYHKRYSRMDERSS